MILVSRGLVDKVESVKRNMNYKMKKTSNETDQREKNDRNGGIWKSGISKSLAEYVQRPVCFVHVQSSLHETVVFSVSVRMCNATYVIIMWNSISGLDTCYHIRLTISCGVAVTVISHQKNIGYLFKGRGGGEMFLRDGPIFEVVFNF